MAAPILTWTTIRACVALAGEATAIPAAAAMVDLAGVPRQGHVPRLVEFTIDPSTPPATANAPTSVVIKIYRALARADAQRELLYTWTIATTDVTNNEVLPIILEGYASEYAVRVSFNGGAAPTFTGNILARALE